MARVAARRVISLSLFLVSIFASLLVAQTFSDTAVSPGSYSLSTQHPVQQNCCSFIHQLSQTNPSSTTIMPPKKKVADEAAETGGDGVSTDRNHHIRQNI